MSPNTKVWAAVALVGILVAAVVTLALFGKDTAPLQTIITAVLAGLGALLYQKVDNVETRVNGNTNKMMDAIINSPPPIPPTETATDNGETKSA